MQKVMKINDKVIVILEDGSFLEREGLTQEELLTVMTSENDEEVFSIMCPEYSSRVKEYHDVCEVLDTIRDSNILTLKGESIYWEEISQLSMPFELVKSILEAENNNDEVKLETYKNFWTLMSLNPDERCRKNLFWFLNKNGLVISRSGFFVAYRNAVLKEVVNGEKIWTDYHSGTTTIRIGHMTTLDRKACDPVQENTCSRGLHLGSKHWLSRNYFGNQGLVCLCNPADVVAVPPLDDYGKLRTCAYLPIAEAEFDAEDKVIPINLETGFDCSYITKVIYEGVMGTEKDSTYKIIIPEVPGLSKENITDKLLDIAMKCVTNRVV